MIWHDFFDLDVERGKSPKAVGGKKDTDKSVKAGVKIAETLDEDAVLAPPPPLEFHVKVQLHHWKTAMDSCSDDSQPPA